MRCKNQYGREKHIITRFLHNKWAQRFPIFRLLFSCSSTLDVVTCLRYSFALKGVLSYLLFKLNAHLNLFSTSENVSIIWNYYYFISFSCSLSLIKRFCEEKIINSSEWEINKNCFVFHIRSRSLFICIKIKLVCCVRATVVLNSFHHILTQFSCVHEYRVSNKSNCERQEIYAILIHFKKNLIMCSLVIIWYHHIFVCECGVFLN